MRRSAPTSADRYGWNRRWRADDIYESYWPEVDDVLLSDVSIDLPVAMSTANDSFVDLAALHLVTTESLAALAGARTREHDHHPTVPPEPRDRHRTERCVGFVENEWRNRSARLGGATLTLTDPSPRCVMTTVAQGDLPRDLEVLRTLARHNRIETPGLGTFACLGLYAEVVAPGRWPWATRSSCSTGVRDRRARADLTRRPTTASMRASGRRPAPRDRVRTDPWP